MMSIFNEYADYYNLFYKDKDYKSETLYVDSLIKKYSTIKVTSILNIGCGSGNHDKYFSELGYNIEGFDISPKMIELANSKEIKNANFFVEDIKNFTSAKKYDCIVSLFHVLSYQTSNFEVNRMFEIAKNNLKEDGIFIFDCWYGPGVFNDPPVTRIKEFKNENEKILRIAEPEMHFDKNLVEVKYKLMVYDKNSTNSKEINEIHKMRYFFVPELKLFAEKNNLNYQKSFAWLTNEEPNRNNWNLVTLLKR